MRAAQREKQQNQRHGNFTCIDIRIGLFGHYP